MKTFLQNLHYRLFFDRLPVVFTKKAKYFTEEERRDHAKRMLKRANVRVLHSAGQLFVEGKIERYQINCKVHWFHIEARYYDKIEKKVVLTRHAKRRFMERYKMEEQEAMVLCREIVDNGVLIPSTWHKQTVNGHVYRYKEYEIAVKLGSQAVYVLTVFPNNFTQGK